MNASLLSADPYERIADILPKLAVNAGWLKLIGEALVEQKDRQRRTKPVPTSPEQLAHIERKRAARHRARRGHIGIALALLSPRPSRRGVVVSPRGAP